MKKSFCILLAAAFACLAAGCGAPGISVKGILRALYLEYTGERYEVRLVCFEGSPSADAGETEEAAVLIAGQGESVRAALEDAQQGQSRQLFYGQNELLLLGPRLARQGLFDALRYLVRQETGRPNVTVYLTDLTLDDLEARQEEMGDLLAEVGQIRTLGGYNCYLYQLGGAEQCALLPNLHVDPDSGNISSDGMTVYRQGRPAHRWDENQLQLALLLSGQQKTLHFTAQGEEGPVSFTLHSAHAVYTPQERGNALGLDISIQGDIRRVETDEGAQSPLNDERYELFLQCWLEELAKEMAADTFEEGNDLFLLRSHIDGLDAAAAARQAQAGELYKEKTLNWECRARVL